MQISVKDKVITLKSLAKCKQVWRGAYEQPKEVKERVTPVPSEYKSLHTEFMCRLGRRGKLNLATVYRHRPRPFLDI